MPYVPPLVNRLDGVLAKDEGGTYGTDAAPAAATDGLRISDRIWQRLRTYYLNPNLRDDAANGSYVPLGPAGATGLVSELDVGWEVRGRGSAYSGVNTIEPGAHALHGACGWPGIFSVNLYNYAPLTTGARPSSTVYVYASGMLWKIVGCRGRLTYLFRPGKLTIARFQLKGLVLAIGTDVALPAITYNTQLPPPAVSLAAAVGAFTPDPLEIALDGGNNVEFVESVNAQIGVQSADYGMIIPTWRFRVKTQPLATYSPLADQAVPTTRALALAQGTAANNKVAVADTGLYLIQQATEEQTQMAGYQLTYRSPQPIITYGA